MSDHRGAIENLLYSYANAIDDGDYEAIGALFARASLADADGNALVTGSEAVTGMYNYTTFRYDDGTPRTHHVTTNLLIEIADDELTATCQSRFTVFQKTESLPLQPIIAGRYADSFARTDGEWHFTERRMRPTLYGDLTQHLPAEFHQP
jgi:3-phenylpropionate/cinnamic acid dioxygenase small subunit